MVAGVGPVRKLFNRKLEVPLSLVIIIVIVASSKVNCYKTQQQ